MPQSILVNGIDISMDGTSRSYYTSNGVITGVGVGQQVNIQSPTELLSRANIGTTGVGM